MVYFYFAYNQQIAFRVIYLFLYMKNLTYFVFLLFLFSCDNKAPQNNLNCDEITLYRFIGGKPDMNYVKKTQKVAESWGFAIHYDYGSCGNTNKDKLQAIISKQKSKKGLACLTAKYGENWEEKFKQDLELLE